MPKKKTSFQLTEIQKHYLPAFHWLYSEAPSDRCSGRTTLLAIVHLERALRYPDMEIRVQDHFPMYHADKNLLREIMNLAGEFFPPSVLKKFEVSHSRMSIPTQSKNNPKFDEHESKNHKAFWQNERVKKVSGRQPETYLFLDQYEITIDYNHGWSFRIVDTKQLPDVESIVLQHHIKKTS